MRFMEYLKEYYYKKGRGPKQMKKKQQVKFNQDVSRILKKLGGKDVNLDWDTITHLFHQGKDAEYTAKRMKDIQDGKR